MSQSNNFGMTILKHFDVEQAAHIQVILGRLIGISVLVELLWENALRQSEDPVREAEDLRDLILGNVHFKNLEDPVQLEAQNEIERRLSAIVRRVNSDA